MAKRETRTDDRDPTAAVAAVLDAARREAGGIGKSARRKLARLERRIITALKAEAKRRRQFDEARTELADLVGRVAGLVQPASDGPASDGPAADAATPAATPKPAAPKSTRKPRVPKAAAPKPAAPKPAAAKPAAAAKAAPARASAAARRRSLRNDGESAGGPDS